jgi:hypothetical protein
MVCLALSRDIGQSKEEEGWKVIRPELGVVDGWLIIISLWPCLN